MTDTSDGSEPNDRTPMTGFCAFTLTSATGAKFWLMPIARSSLPLICAASYALGTLRPAPSAMLPGSWVAGGPTRVTTPCSWSVLISSGMPRRCDGRDPLQAVGQAGDLRRVGHVVRPGEVDDAADVVLLDQLLAVGDAELLLVVRDVGRVGRVGRLPVGVGDEELPDLLLERHPLDDLVDPVAAAGRRRGRCTERGHGDRTCQEQQEQRSESGRSSGTVPPGRGTRGGVARGSAARSDECRRRDAGLEPSNEMSTRSAKLNYTPTTRVNGQIAKKGRNPTSPSAR